MKTPGKTTHTGNTESPGSTERLRLDKWLWAARFFKTRALAVEAIDKHRVRVNGAPAKPSREVHAGDELDITQGPVQRTVRVLGVSAVRGPAPQAALLYQETEASAARRQAQAEQRRLAPEPALALTQGRPTKRDRRQMDTLRGGPGPASAAPAAPTADWDQRWSARWPER